MTITEFTNLTWKEIQELSDSEINDLVKTMSRYANRRITSIRRYNTPAYAQWESAGEILFGNRPVYEFPTGIIKGMQSVLTDKYTRNDRISELKRIQKFLSASTSTVSGYKEQVKKQDVRVFGVRLTAERIDEFSEALTLRAGINPYTRAGIIKTNQYREILQLLRSQPSYLTEYWAEFRKLYDESMDSTIVRAQSVIHINAKNATISQNEIDEMLANATGLVASDEYEMIKKLMGITSGSRIKSIKGAYSSIMRGYRKWKRTGGSSKTKSQKGKPRKAKP